MTSTHARPRVLAAALLLAATTVAAPAATAATQAGCPFTGPHVYHWVGGDGHWYQDSHWTSTGVPGKAHTTAHTDYACIDNGSTVTLVNTPLAEAVGLRGLYVAGGSHVVISRGRFLFVNGPATQPSIVRAGSGITDKSGSLGGLGTLEVFGTVRATAHSYGAASFTTRQCAESVSCSGAPARPGRLRIEHGGSMLVNGPTGGGVNLFDHYVLDNEGTVTLTRTGYFAADWGTSIVNRHGGHLLIANDRGIYEGSQRADTPPDVVNHGDVAKTAGTGTSVIGIHFVREQGSDIRVKSGTLVINNAALPRATVDQGRSYGTGGCPSDTPCPHTTNSTNKQTTTVQLPSAFSGSGDITIAQGGASSAPAHIGKSVQVSTPGAAASTAHPMHFVFSFLQSAYPQLSGNQWRTVRLFRSDGQGYSAIKHCRADGTPRAGQQSCLDMRRTSSGSSRHGASNVRAGIVNLVVRTTQNSRWVVV
jgi:hypothetical protein